MQRPGYRRLSKSVVYENAWLRFEAHEIVHPNGTPGVHGVVATPPASAVVLLDGSDVLLARQARFAIDRIVLEVVKGGRHAGEDALGCAQRESREEAGVEAACWRSLGVTYEIPSVVQEPVALFLGERLRTAPLPPEGVERIDVVRLPFDDALEACADGRIADAVTAIALLRTRHLLESRT